MKISEVTAKCLEKTASLPSPWGPRVPAVTALTFFTTEPSLGKFYPPKAGLPLTPEIITKTPCGETVNREESGWGWGAWPRLWRRAAPPPGNRT